MARQKERDYHYLSICLSACLPAYIYIYVCVCVCVRAGVCVCVWGVCTTF